MTISGQTEFFLYPQGVNLLNNPMGQEKIIERKPSGKSAETAQLFADMMESVAQKRDKEAFITLFEHFAPRVKSFLMKGGLTPDMADELAQETMLTVWHKAESFDPKQAAVSTWIFTIARNKRIDFFRKSGRAQMDLTDPALTQSLEQPLPDQSLFDSEKEQALKTAIEELPEEQAHLIQKAFFEEKTHKDIAKETGVPLGTVKSRIRLAVDKLRYHLGDLNA